MAKRAAACLLLAALGGCAGRGAYLVSPAVRDLPDARVAVLPFGNQSTAVDADAIMRKLAAERLERRGYSPLPLEGVDEALRGLGVSDAGQLSAVSSSETASAVGADLLCYGDVEDFTFQNLGFVVRKAVTLKVKLVSAATGETLYEGTGSGRDMKVHVSQDEAKAAFVEQLAVKLVQNILKSPLKREAEAAADKALDRLPRR